MPINGEQNERKVTSIGKYMFFGMWIGLLALLSLFFYSWEQNEFNPNRSIDSKVNVRGQTELVLTANRHHQYIANGFINNTPVVFLLDTGANSVSIPEHIAKKIGLKRGRQLLFETANGTAIGYQTKINKIKLGDIELENISASINPNVQFDEVLLGMSFLKHMELVQKNNTLTLRY